MTEEWKLEWEPKLKDLSDAYDTFLAVLEKYDLKIEGGKLQLRGVRKATPGGAGATGFAIVCEPLEDGTTYCRLE